MNSNQPKYIATVTIPSASAKYIKSEEQLKLEADPNYKAPKLPLTNISSLALSVADAAIPSEKVMEFQISQKERESIQELKKEIEKQSFFSTTNLTIIGISVSVIILALVFYFKMKNTGMLNNS